MVLLFGFGGRGVADWLQQTPMVEPIDPCPCGELDGLEGSPRSAAVDHFRLVEAIDRFRQSVVTTVADAADRRFDTGFCEAFCIFYTYILRSAVAVMNRPAPGRDVAKVRDPQPVRRRGMELPVDAIQRAMANPSRLICRQTLRTL